MNFVLTHLLLRLCPMVLPLAIEGPCARATPHPLSFGTFRAGAGGYAVKVDCSGLKTRPK